MAVLLSAFPITGVFLLMCHHYWDRRADDAFSRHRFLVWAGRGLVIPMAFWIAGNCNLVPGVPIFVPEIAIARYQTGTRFQWLAVLVESCGPALMVVSSYWSAATLMWLLSDLFRRPHDFRDLKSEVIFWTAVGSPLAAFLFYAFGWSGSGIALSVLLLPLVHVSTPLEKQKSRPSYDRAVARLKFGKYKEAEREVLEELDSFEEDFDGWMMLAELYATHFKELPEADRTIRDLCSQPGILGVQIAVAFHRLADWHLNLGADPTSARRALEEIPRLLPETHFARMAHVRLEQLPESREDLIEQRKPKTLKLPALRDPLDAGTSVPTLHMTKSDARTAADRCVEKLRRNPNDVAVREKFAILLSEQLGQGILAIEQMELLLQMPEQPEQKSAEWLATIAAWELTHRQDQSRAKAALERIVRLYPKSRQAFTAQRWLDQFSQPFSSDAE